MKTGIKFKYLYWGILFIFVVGFIVFISPYKQTNTAGLRAHAIITTSTPSLTVTSEPIPTDAPIPTPTPLVCPTIIPQPTQSCNSDAVDCKINSECGGGTMKLPQSVCRQTICCKLMYTSVLVFSNQACDALTNDEAGARNYGGSVRSGY